MNFAKIIGKVFEHWKITTAVAIILAAGLGGILAFFTTPKPKSDKPEDIAKFAASSKFDRLSNKEKEAYLRKLRPPRPGERRNRGNNPMRNMSDRERRALFRQMGAMRQRQMLKEYRAYMKMDQTEKNAFLDAKIAEQDKRMAEFAKRRAEREARRAQNAQNGQNTQNGQNAQQPPRPTPEQRASFMKSRIESESPEIRAARQTMMRDIMKRRRETGKAMPRPPQGGRGGGRGR